MSLCPLHVTPLPCPLCEMHTKTEVTFTTTTSTAEPDILLRLRLAWLCEKPMGIDVRLLLCEAADEIDFLRARLAKANRPWWKRWLQP